MEKARDAKNILFLCGSRSDKSEENLERIDTAVRSMGSLDHAVEVASADRLEEILAPTINEHNPDGIIYFGAYSLVLGSAITNNLDRLARNPFITDGRKTLEEFYRNGNLRQRPPAAANPLVKSSLTDGRFRPVIGVPMNDSVSGGVYAFTAIIGNPSVSEPRPAVGRENFEAAVNGMYKILKNDYNSYRVINQVDLEEPGRRLSEAAGSTGIRDKASDGSFKDADVDAGTLNIIISEAGKNAGPQLERIDKKTEGQPGLYICVPVKQKTDFSRYLDMISDFNSGIFMGPGAYENTAILAARILTLSSSMPEKEKEKIGQNIRRYMNTKTADSIYGIKR
ncbi:MAG: hypothetical protein R6U32_03490 [Candidatus Woesearchaeota archaeon]